MPVGTILDKSLTSREANDDRKPAVKRRQTTLTFEEEDEECWSSRDDDGDHKLTAKQRQTSEKDDAMKLAA
jgi:hypothetical protein